MVNFQNELCVFNVTKQNLKAIKKFGFIPDVFAYFRCVDLRIQNFATKKEK